MPWSLIWSAFTSRAGILALAFGAVIIFYEGLPIGPLRYIPFVGPKLEAITDGRVDKARKAGAFGERLLWEEARRKLLAQRDEERRKTQAEIDMLEQDLLDAADAARVTNEQFENVIREMEAENAVNPGSAKPVLPRRLSNELNKIGR